MQRTPEYVLFEIEVCVEDVIPADPADFDAVSRGEPLRAERLSAELIEMRLTEVAQCAPVTRKRANDARPERKLMPPCY